MFSWRSTRRFSNSARNLIEKFRSNFSSYGHQTLSWVAPHYQQRYPYRKSLWWVHLRNCLIMSVALWIPNFWYRHQANPPDCSSLTLAWNSTAWQTKTMTSSSPTLHPIVLRSWRKTSNAKFYSAVVSSSLILKYNFTNLGWPIKNPRNSKRCAKLANTCVSQSITNLNLFFLILDSYLFFTKQKQIIEDKDDAISQIR